MVTSLLNTTRQRAKPVKMAFLVMMTVGLFEILVIAQHGNQAIHLYSKVVPLLLFMDAIGFAIGAAVTSIYSRTAPGKCRVSVGYFSVIYAVLLGLIVALVFFFIATTIGNLEYEQVMTFLAFYLPLTSLIFANHVGLALLRAMGKSGSCARVLLLSAFGHFLLLSTALVHGLAGIDFLQILGFTYCISVITTSLLLVTQIPNPAGVIRRRINRAEASAFVVRLTNIAWKSAVSNLMTPLGVFITLTILARQSDDHAVAFTLALKVEMFVLVGFYALSSVIGAIAGERMRLSKPLTLQCCLPLIMHCLIVGLGLAVALAIVQQFFGYALLNCSAGAVELLRVYFLLVPISYGAYGFVMLIQAIANGEGNPNIGLLLSFLRTIGFFLVLLFQPLEHGVFLAITIANIFVSFLSLYLLRKGRSRHLQFS